MKYCIFLFLITIGSHELKAQSSISELETLLTNKAKRRWVFDKLEKTLGQKTSLLTGCEYASLTFTADSSKYFGSLCASNTNKKGQFKITQKGTEEFTIQLEKNYEIAFYEKVRNGKKLQFMRLKIPGIGMQQAALEYHYYAE